MALLAVSPIRAHWPCRPCPCPCNCNCNCNCGCCGCWASLTLLRLLALLSHPQADFAKMRVKELRRVCEDEGLDTKGLVEKDEYIKKIKAHFNIKDEV